ncbi:hypothetical protein GTY41_19750 [Streptomyces sp. SID685]|uniref:hypothetical protein n=1 Tax=Streptomyces sp. SID685 TaxID=2690322 RepID=UPI00136B4098|nr:hypothetical protein [Streptomyces sp. SID685]MYR87118.1 hypothetical protein [Streptomyces sp. SID685]
MSHSHAGSWSLDTNLPGGTMRAGATAVVALALTLTACSSNDQASTKPSAATAPTVAPTQKPADGHHYTSAQDIADALKAAGLTVSKLRKDTGDNYISQVGGSAYNFTVTDRGQAPGTAGINMFPNPEALAAWIPLLKSFGGVAVTGGTWAVSLPTDGDARNDSKRLAPTIAKALGGTVRQ